MILLNWLFYILWMLKKMEWSLLILKLVKTTHALQILGGRTPATPLPKSAPESSALHYVLIVGKVHLWEWQVPCIMLWRLVKYIYEYDSVLYNVVFNCFSVFPGALKHCGTLLLYLIPWCYLGWFYDEMYRGHGAIIFGRPVLC